MDIQQAIARVIENRHLLQDEMVAVMRQIMTGGATPAQIAGFIVALRMKGETIDEISAAVQVMRELVTPVHVEGEHLVDIVGTGGDGAGLFNISTASAFVVAVAGGQVVKHGNRAVSSASGSADLVEAAGIRLDLTPAEVARCVREVGIGFMFAPAHHSAMKYAAGPRRELGVRTLFNILGPMTNPAGAPHALIGVFNPALCRPVAEVLGRLGGKCILAVTSAEGLDEISLAGATHVAEWNDGSLREYQITPEQFGVARQSLEGLTVTGAAQSLTLIRDALGKRRTAAGNKAADIIALNAGAAIYAARLADDLQEGVALAQDAVVSGLAGEKMDEMAAFTDCLRDGTQ